MCFGKSAGNTRWCNHKQIRLGDHIRHTGEMRNAQRRIAPDAMLQQGAFNAVMSGEGRSHNDVVGFLKEGKLVTLIGANGAGKTTFLKAISGLLPCRAGAIRLDGADISRLSSDKRVRAGISQVPENRQIFGPLTIEDNLRLGGYTRTEAERREMIRRSSACFQSLRSGVGIMR